MDNNELKKRTVSNLIWRFAERCGAQAVAFIVSLVLARILDPSHYGVISLVTVFTAILQVFVDSGLGNALIQKKDADDLDFSTVFYCNIVFCLILYWGLFFVSPFIASFYKNPELTPVIRVLGLTIIISGIKGVQQAYVSKHLIFKRFFFATLGGTIGAAIVGIVMALNGFGVWALVAQQIFNATVDTFILWITVKWRPKKMFSFKRLKGLYSYGWKLLVASLINTIYTDVRQLIIGKIYSSEDLAFYNRGKQFPDFIVTNINSSIDSVLLPVMSQAQDDMEGLRNMTRRSIKTSSYFMWPMMVGLAVLGKPLIQLILTDKWLPCLPFLYIFCFVKGLEPIQTANLNAIKAMGRTDINLKLEIIKKTTGILIVLSTMRISVLALGLSVIAYTLFASVVNSFPNKRLLGYSYFEQIADILPYLGMSLVMGGAMYAIGLFPFPFIVSIFIQFTVGVFVYALLSKLLHNDSYEFICKLVFNMIKKNRNV